MCGINIIIFSSHESPEVRVECVAMCGRLVLVLAHAQTSHLLLHLGHLWGGEITQPWYSLDTCTQTTCTLAPTHATHTHTHTHSDRPPTPHIHPNSNPPGSAFESSTLVAELAVLSSAADDKGNHGDTQHWAGLHCGRDLNCTMTRWLPCPMAAKLPAEVCPYQREAVVCPHQREAEVCPLQRGGGQYSGPTYTKTQWLLQLLLCQGCLSQHMVGVSQWALQCAVSFMSREGHTHYRHCPILPCVCP